MRCVYKTYKKLYLIEITIFFFILLVFRKFPWQTKSAVILDYEKCFYSALNQQQILKYWEFFLSYDLISSHPKMWRKFFIGKINFLRCFFFVFVF